MESLYQDIRYGLRSLLKNRAFTALAVTTLALAIGANTAIFSVVSAVLLSPLPYQEPERLTLLTEYDSARSVVKTGVSYPDYVEFAGRNRVFEQMAAYLSANVQDGFVLGGTASAQRVRGTTVSNNFFSVLGVQPALGRNFVEGEERSGGAKVFLISDRLWCRAFGASHEAIGRTYLIDGVSYTLIGVMPPGLEFPAACDLWLPLGILTERELNDRVSHPYWVLARLRQGIKPMQAQIEIEGIERQLAQAHPETNANWRTRVSPLLDEFVGNVRLSLLVLSGAVVFILLIACANVMNLLLARSLSRQKEFAIRLALGAGKPRLVRQSLTECLVIVSVSTALALLLAKWSLRLIVGLSAGSIQRIEQFHLNGQMLGFAVALAVVVTVLVGLAPAFQLSDLNFQGYLRQGQQSGPTGVGSQRLRGALVISEVALTLLLLCGAGLMLRSFAQVSKAHPGFDTENLLTMKIALPDAQYLKTEQRTAFLRQLLERLESLPGVKAVGATNTLPLSGETNWGTINIVGRPILDRAHAPTVEGRSVSASYFRAMGIPLARGREFREGDPDEARRVIMINQAMANKFWPGAEPIGQRVMFLSEQPRSREVIGVVGDVRHFGLETEGEPEMYTPYGYWSSMNLALRANSNPTNLIAAIRTEVAAVDKDVPVYQVATMDELAGQSMGPRRFNLFLLALFAGLALILSAVGLYGLLAFGVRRRSHEIGLRMALGARPITILRLIVWQGMRLVLSGLVIGVLASLGLTRVMSNLLYGVSVTDPATLTGVAILLVLVGLLACYLPARRAMRVDPLIALRQE